MAGRSGFRISIRQGLHGTRMSEKKPNVAPRMPLARVFSRRNNGQRQQAAAFLVESLLDGLGIVARPGALVSDRIAPDQSPEADCGSGGRALQREAGMKKACFSDAVPTKVPTISVFLG